MDADPAREGGEPDARDPDRLRQCDADGFVPPDNRIYLDLSFFNELGSRFGAPGEFAQAYVIAHEYGHHIQTLMGTMNGERSSGAEGNSVRIELQADCYAGVWANRANAQFNILQNGDVEGGLRAAEAVGDDTLENKRGLDSGDSFAGRHIAIIGGAPGGAMLRRVMKPQRS